MGDEHVQQQETTTRTGTSEVGAAPASDGRAAVGQSAELGGGAPPGGDPNQLASQELTGQTCDAGPSTLMSADPDVDGRTVTEVGADVRERAGRYAEAIPRFRAISESTQRQEEAWYAEMGLIGGFIDLFNSADQTNPQRWDAVMVEWEEADGAFARALAITVSDDRINDFGQAGEEAMAEFDQALTLDQQRRDEFAAYLQGFQQSAQTVLTVTTIVRDISFAAAVGIAVVVAAPVVFTAAGAFATGTLGLGATGSTLFAGGATATSMGLIGSTIEGSGQAVGALVFEATDLLYDLMDENTTWEEAIDGFDWGLIADQGWEGVKRGFVDGVLAYAGMGFERVLHGGASVMLNRVLGEAGETMLATMLRHAMTRAMASGASGGVIGALDAGIKTAMAGGDIGAIGQAMQDGFVMGAVVGTVLGGAGGALEGRGIAQVRTEVDALEMLLRDDPAAFAQRFDELVEGMDDAQRAAFRQEVQGRRFVDDVHYQEAAGAHAAGESSVVPEHRYGETEFNDWDAASSQVSEHAQSANPLTSTDLEQAHATAARNVTDTAGSVRTQDVIGAGGVGHQRMWTALTPQQLAILDSNPHITLLHRGVVDGALDEGQLARGMETAIIQYPPANEVGGKLDDFFVWYTRTAGTRDAVDFAAEAQRRLVSIHPFADGNGRVSRLVMDHALESQGLPPPLLRDPNLDYMVSPAVWSGEVRAGIMETYRTAARHVGLFNAALSVGRPAEIALRWGAILGLTSESPQQVSDRVYAE
ncbi:MAG: prophage maintenance system killer protein [Bradymonadia bacterium]|jgi:prophage maintenance system killer protein